MCFSLSGECFLDIESQRLASKFYPIFPRVVCFLKIRSFWKESLTGFVQIDFMS